MCFRFEVSVEVTLYGKSGSINRMLMGFGGDSIQVHHYEISGKRLDYTTNRYW